MSFSEVDSFSELVVKVEGADGVTLEDEVFVRAARTFKPAFVTLSG